MRWTKQDLDEYQARFDAMTRPGRDDDTPDPGHESVLSGKIVKYCKANGLPCQCFPSTPKAKGLLVPGWPD